MEERFPHPSFGAYFCYRHMVVNYKHNHKLNFRENNCSLISVNRVYQINHHRDRRSKHSVTQQFLKLVCLNFLSLGAAYFMDAGNSPFTIRLFRSPLAETHTYEVVVFMGLTIGSEVLVYVPIWGTQTGITVAAHKDSFFSCNNSGGMTRRPPGWVEDVFKLKIVLITAWSLVAKWGLSPQLLQHDSFFNKFISHFYYYVAFSLP